jgi:RNA polymerase sigma factor (sigma-70 family)
MTENDKDIELLRSEPHSLILKYQETVKIIVKKFIIAGIFTAGEYEDIVQEVNVALLTKIPAMQSQYNGMSLFRTYFSVIVRNICMKEHAKIDTEIILDQEGIIGFIDNTHVEEKIAFEEEIQKFRSILGLYYRQRPKLLLCLKLYYRIPLTSEDINLWYPKCSPLDHNILLENFGSNYDGKNDGQIYAIVTPIMNKNEKKDNSADAMRKWTDSKIREIIEMLNGKSRKLTHNEDSLKTLIDNFFSPYLLEK